MRFRRVIEEASVELALVESAVGSARQLLDSAAATERVAIRIAGRLKSIAVIVVVSGVAVVLAVAVTARRARRRSESSQAAGSIDDDPSAVDIA